MDDKQTQMRRAMDLCATWNGYCALNGSWRPTQCVDSDGVALLNQAWGLLHANFPDLERADALLRLLVFLDAIPLFGAWRIVTMQTVFAENHFGKFCHLLRHRNGATNAIA